VIFVTGGAGFIGSQFVRDYLTRKMGQLIVFDALTYAGNLDNLESIQEDGNYQFVRGDITNPEDVLEALPDRCDAVVHFAAESHVDRSILSASEFVRTNVLGTQVLLDAARARKVSRFLHISTDEVGGSIAEPARFREGDPLVPSSPYAASKAAAEHLVHAAHHTFGLDTIITRTSNNYGPFQFPEKLLPLAIAKAMSGEPIPVYGDGMQVRDWIHVEDNCRALQVVLERGKSGSIYHIGGGNTLPNLQVLKTLLRVLGKPESLLTQVVDRLGHDRRYAVDWSKIHEELGWSPKIPFEEGLRSTVEWYRGNQRWVDRARSGEYREVESRIYNTPTA
jgi:dTDP-glucose 4,6-dehydratase